MKGLILDTAYHRSLIVLDVDGNTFTASIEEKRAQAVELLPKIDALLQKAGMTLADLDYLAMAHGPGSFVGLRVAMSALQTFSLVHDIPIVAFSSLRLLAQAAWRVHQASQVSVCVNAFMGEVYFAEYAVIDGVMQTEIKDCLLKPDAIACQFPCVGDACAFVKKNMPVLDQTIQANESDVLALAHHEFTCQRIIACQDLSPVYLRGQSAWKKTPCV